MTSLTKNASGSILLSQTWYLLAPVTYSATIVVTMDSSVKTVVGARSYSGVDQTTPFGAMALSQATASGLAVTITTTMADSLICSDVDVRDLQTLTSNQTIRYKEATSGGANAANCTSAGDDKSAPTVTSYGIFWTNGNSQEHILEAVEILATGAPTPTPTPIPSGPPAGTQSMMGVGL